MRYYEANPLDKRWNGVKFEYVGAYGGKSYVKSDENITFTKPVSLPEQLLNELMQKQEQAFNELVKEFKQRVQEVMDKKAQEKGYDNIVSACSYAGYENEFETEGEAFGKWRAKVWKWGYALMEHYKTNPIDKSLDEVLESMPKLELGANDV